MSANTRKPYLLKAKQRIVALLDAEIEADKKKLEAQDAGFEKEDKDIRRDLAIFIRQRNKIAKEADIALIELTEKDGTGRFIF